VEYATITWQNSRKGKGRFCGVVDHNNSAPPAGHSFRDFVEKSAPLKGGSAVAAATTFPAPPLLVYYTRFHHLACACVLRRKFEGYEHYSYPHHLACACEMRDFCYIVTEVRSCLTSRVRACCDKRIP